MCVNCYEEAGKPAIINEQTQKAAQLINEIYEHDGCGVGGYAHIVVDDWNLDDEFIDDCIRDAENNTNDAILEDGRKACLDCLHQLKQLTEDERFSAMAIADQLI